MTITMRIAAVCGLACVGTAPTLAEPPALEATPLGRDAQPTHVYFNVAIGERVITPLRPRDWNIIWQNDDGAGSCNFFMNQDSPSRDTAATGRVKFGSAVVTWGDIAGPSLVTAYSVEYASNIDDPHEYQDPERGVPGLSMTISIMQNYDGVVEPGGAGMQTVYSQEFFDIPGYVECPGGWICEPPGLYGNYYFDIDLEGSGLEFTLGDPDTGAADLDGDGLYDFAYSYSFTQNQTQPKGVIGPMLVRPASLGGLGSAHGCIDKFDWFNQVSGPFQDYFGHYSFGGGDCRVPRPYASAYLILYGQAVDPCAPIDFTGDAFIDFADYLEFLNRFDAGDVTADLNGDGVVDFTDYLEFLNLYGACGGG